MTARDAVRAREEAKRLPPPEPEKPKRKTKKEPEPVIIGPEPVAAYDG